MLRIRLCVNRCLNTNVGHTVVFINFGKKSRAISSVSHLASSPLVRAVRCLEPTFVWCAYSLVIKIPPRSGSELVSTVLCTFAQLLNNEC